MNSDRNNSMNLKSKAKYAHPAGVQPGKHQIKAFIPNPVGLPSRQAEAEHLRSELNRWKKAGRKKPMARHTQSSSYWQQVSTCTAL